MRCDAEAARLRAEECGGKSVELLRQFRAGNISSAGDGLWRLAMTNGEDDDRAPTRAAAQLVAYALIDLQQLAHDVRAVVNSLPKK